MAENTNISWSDHTWSPWYGCTQVSMGEHGACVGCYARFLSETRQHRVIFGGPGRGEGTRDAKADSGWKEPLKWEREQAAAVAAWRTNPFARPEFPKPSCLVFPSMCDPFDNHPDLPPLLRRFFDLIRATPHLTWLLLTKRPGNIVKLWEDVRLTSENVDVDWDGPSRGWPHNAAIGFTSVTQPEMDRDSRHALAAFRELNPAFLFWSGEPLLAPTLIPDDLLALGPRFWAITGGETDQGSHKARPSHPDWFRSLRDQCAAAGVAYHHKQNGEFREFPSDSGVTEEIDHKSDEAAAILNAAVKPSWIAPDGRHFHAARDLPYDLPCRLMERVGKKAAGRLLDGVEHNARPEVRHGR